MFQIALHFNARPADRMIVMNSAKKAGKKWKWKREVRIAWLYSLFPGDHFNLIVTVEKKFYKFQLNEHKYKETFPHREKYSEVKTLAFGGPKGTWSAVHRSCLLMDKDFAGGDIKTFITKDKNIIECKTACMAEKACKAYTYIKADGRCYIKHSGHKKLSVNAKCISGLKKCYTGNK